MLGVSDLGRLHGQGLGDPSLPLRLPGGPYGLLARSAVRDVTQAAGALRGEAHGDLLAEDRARALRRPLPPEGGAGGAPARAPASPPPPAPGGGEGPAARGSSHTASATSGSSEGACGSCHHPGAS